MADDTVDNEHPSFVIIVNDTVKNEHPRVNAGTLGDEAEDQPTNGSTVGSKKDVDSKDDIGETDAHGHNKTDETDDGANIEDKNREIDIKGEDNRSANESVSLDQGNVQQLDNNSVKTEEKKDAYTELREDDNIGINAGTLGDEAEGQPTNGSIVGSKNDVDSKDDIGETDAHGHQQTDETDDGTNIKKDKSSERDIKEEDNQETDTHGHQQTDDTDDGTKIKDKHSEIDIKVEDNRENDSIRPDQAQVQLPEDKNDVRSKGETSVHTKSCSDDNICPNDIPKETGSVKQMVAYTEEKQRLELQDQKERLLHSKTGTESNNIQKLQNDVDSLGNKLAESERAKLEMAQKDISNQEEIIRLKELNSTLQTRLENEQQTHRKLTEEKETQSKKHKKELDEMRKKNCRVENELVQMKEENQRLKNDMKKEAEKHKKEKDQVYKKMVEKDKEIEKSKTIIQKLEEEISKIKRENVRNVTEMNMQTERLLQDADQIQKNLEKKCKTLQNEIEGKTNQLQWLTSRFNQEKEGYLQQVQILTAEKKDLLLRLSKVASANMTYNNPNIADLSDEKRPTKLAEEFSELYDNEWTDAFEEIEGGNEQDKLTFILELLKRANQLCMDLSNEHTRKVKQSISTLKILIPNKQEQNRTDGSSDKDKLHQSEQEQNLPESNEHEKGNQNGDDGRRKVSEERQDTLTEEAHSPDESQKESQSSAEGRQKGTNRGHDTLTEEARSHGKSQKRSKLNGDKGRENWTKEEKDKLTKESRSCGTSQNGSESSGDEGKEKFTKEGQDTMTEEARSSGKGQNGSGSNGDEGREEGIEEGQDTLTEKARSSDKKQHGSESDGNEENNLGITQTDQTEGTASTEKQNNTYVENDNDKRYENDMDLDEKPNRSRVENENANKIENNLDEDDTEENNLGTKQNAEAEDTANTEGDEDKSEPPTNETKDTAEEKGDEDKSEHPTNETKDTAEEKGDEDNSEPPTNETKDTGEEKGDEDKSEPPTNETKDTTEEKGDEDKSEPPTNETKDTGEEKGDEDKSEPPTIETKDTAEEKGDEDKSDPPTNETKDTAEEKTAEDKQQAMKEKQSKPSETCEAESSTNTEISPDSDGAQHKLSKDRDSIEKKKASKNTKDDNTCDTFTQKNESKFPDERDDHQKKKKIQATEVSQSLTEGECLAEQGDMSSESQVINRNDKIQEPKPKKKIMESDFEKLQTEQKKAISDATKFFETLLSEDVKNALKEVIVHEKGIDDEKQKCVVVYIEKCIDLCWSMLRHKPPVHVDFPDIISDIPFDTNKYKPYTKSGKHLAYIVWPALYLHEGGPLLSKGVAQGK